MLSISFAAASPRVGRAQAGGEGAAGGVAAASGGGAAGSGGGGSGAGGGGGGGGSGVATFVAAGSPACAGGTRGENPTPRGRFDVNMSTAIKPTPTQIATSAMLNVGQ